MKKTLKIALFILCAVLILILGVFTAYFAVTASAELDENKLVDLERVTEFYDAKGNFIEKNSGGVEIVKIDALSPYVYNAFVAIEDKRFYDHGGVDTKGLARAFFKNVTSLSFKEGASTISQQLIKNTHLSGEKTIKRKFKEIKLALELEKNYDKKEILEKYLNTIYFGNECYGITEASKTYFEKPPENLSVNESAILAAIIKAPSKYTQNGNRKLINDRKNTVLKEMYTQNYISKNEYENAVKEKVVFAVDEEKNSYDFMDMANNEVKKILTNSPYKYKKLKVYTTFDKKMQDIIYKHVNTDNVQTDKTAIILGKDNSVLAYYSTAPKIRRQAGSTIKPILIYAPSIEENQVYPCSKITDEKINYSGYTPDNYGDKYYGDVSIRFSLSKSLNSCAVKLLNNTGISKCIDYASKTEIPFTNNDRNLSIALGSTEKGVTLDEITAAYSVFRENGYYSPVSTIQRIENENGKTVYERKINKTKVFSEDTAEIMNDMLNDVVKTGTARKLFDENITLCAKTGTVGNDKGNTDAYTVSYNPEYTLGIWYGNKDYSLMPNNITGGNAPSSLSKKIWDEIYAKEVAPVFNNEYTEKIKLDKFSLENGDIELADKIAPDRYTVEEIFKKGKLPTAISTRFSSPKIENYETSLNNNVISIRLCLTQMLDARVYVTHNGIKVLVSDTKNMINKENITDVLKLSDTVYEYSVIPYYNFDGKEYQGEETVLCKIKSPRNITDELWWQD